MTFPIGTRTRAYTHAGILDGRVDHLLDDGRVWITLDDHPDDWICVPPQWCALPAEVL